MQAILAINELGWIGLNGKLPWKCRADLQHFKAMTMGKTLLVGRTTYESMPELKGRKVVVVGTGYNTLSEALKMDIDYVIGGKSMYEGVSHLITHIHLSVIDNYTVGDVYAPRISLKVPMTVYEFSEG
tara:strand:+ start:403 stop:786 length:384 start_codon:yes stop_codon:yes gene_type:complete